MFLYEDESEEDEFTDDEEHSNDEEEEADEPPTQFDNLCDGVIACLALVHESGRELYDFQDELMRHKVPPSVLLYLTIVAGKMYRSISDLHQPTNELIRLVRLFSTPWDEKSRSLRKLHDSYERKCRQLSIAINRLKLVDTQAKQMQHTKQILNWEKLFLRMTTSQGSAVQWRFAIEPLRQRLSFGPEKLQDIVKELDRAGDAVILAESSQDFETTSPRLKLRSPPPPPVMSPEEKNEEEDASDDEESRSDVESAEPPPPKVETEDTGTQCETTTSAEAHCWTRETRFEWRLHMRVYTPRLNMQYEKIKCLIKFADQARISGYLDEQERRTESATSRKGSPGGKKRGRLKNANSDLAAEKLVSAQKHEDMVFRAPFKARFGWDISKEKVKVSLLQGVADEIFALGTVDVQELEAMETPVVELPEPRSGYEFEPDPVEKMHRLRKEQLVRESDYFNMSRPLLYPLFSVLTSNVVEVVVANIPMSFYWSITPIPMQFERGNVTAPLYELVEELTAIGSTTTQEEHDLKDTAVSPMSQAGEFIRVEPEPTGPSADEISALITKHAEELHVMQNEYEDKIAELTKALTLAQMQSGSAPVANVATSRRRLKSPVSVPTARSPKEGGVTHHTPVKPRKKVKSAIGTLPNWGEFLPEDFLERVELFMSESLRHRNQLNERLTNRIQNDIERKLADQYKLSRQEGTDWEQDLTLPALFMPVRSGNVYNPRAHQYFHANTAGDPRITQPPSIMQLPPIPSNRMAIVNLFEMCNPGASIPRDDLYSRIQAPPPSQKTANEGVPAEEEPLLMDAEVEHSSADSSLDGNGEEEQNVIKIPDGGNDDQK